jgi:hypothetical protein
VLRLTNAFVIAMAALGTAGTHHSQQYLFGLAAQELRKCGVKNPDVLLGGRRGTRGDPYKVEADCLLARL